MITLLSRLLDSRMSGPSACGQAMLDGGVSTPLGEQGGQGWLASVHTWSPSPREP